MATPIWVSQEPEVPSLGARFGARVGPLRPILVALGATAATAITARAWTGLFSSTGTVWAFVVVGALAGAVGGVVTGSRRIPGGLATVIGVVVAVGAAAVVAAGSPSELRRILVEGPTDLATLGLLMRPDRALLFTPALIAGAGAWCAAHLAMERRGTPLLVLPVAMAHAATAVYTTSRAVSPVVTIVVAVASVGVLMLVGRLGDDERSSLIRRLPGAAVMVGVATAVAAVVAFGTTDADTLDLRSRIERPITDFETVSPITRIKRGLETAGEATPAFTIELAGLPTGSSVELLPVAHLDHYDGVVWTTTNRFTDAGAELPTIAQSVESDAPIVRQTIELADTYPMALVPMAGAPLAHDAARLAWDAQTGTIARFGDDLPTTFDTEVQLRSAARPATDAPPPVRNLSLAATPAAATVEQRDALRTLVAAAAPGSTAMARLAALETTLRSDAFGYQPESPAGSALPQLLSYLGANEAEGSQIGFSEQAAGAFALAARELGLPSRVVVGYRLLDQPLTSARPSAEVRLDQIHAWPEVWFDDGGWIRFEPTNEENATDSTGAASATLNEQQQSPEQLPDPVELQEPDRIIPDPPAEQTFGAVPGWLVAVIAGTVASIIAVLGLKALRRARRRAGTPAERTIGAWLDLRDRLTDLGHDVPASASVIDLRDDAQAADSDAAISLGLLAPLVDRALYDPDPTGVDDEDAWNLAKAVAREHASDASIARRALAPLNVRSLVSR